MEEEVHGALFLMHSVAEQTKVIKRILPVASQPAVKTIQLHLHMVVNIT